MWRRFFDGVRGSANQTQSAVGSHESDGIQSDFGSGETAGGVSQVKALKKGTAMRVIFFYPGEEGTYVDNANVTLFENGIVHIKSNQEETTTHLQNCEILWRFETEADDRAANKVRLLKPKGEGRSESSPDSSPNSSRETKPENKPPHPDRSN
jgi:hypothetical protein